MTTKNWLITIALTTGSALSTQALAAGAGMAGGPGAGMAGGSAGTGMAGTSAGGVGGARAGTASPVGNLGSSGTPATPPISGASPPTISGSMTPTISGALPGTAVNGVPVIQNGVTGPGQNQGTVITPGQPNVNPNGTPINNSATETPSNF